MFKSESLGHADRSNAAPSGEEAIAMLAAQGEHDHKSAELLSRMEALPFTRWHAKARILMGSATFFDAFAALSLAYALPVLIGLWKLKAGQVGLLIATGYIGQLIGALGFGAMAERYGRIKGASAAVLVISLMGIACIFANSFTGLLVCRFIQGIGLGGEVPVAATYINELSQAKRRGRFFMLYEMIFPIGLMAAGQLGAWLVPSLGWHALFLVGALPTLIIAFGVMTLPESPRWLIHKGRLAEAERVVEQAEASAARKGYKYQGTIKSAAETTTTLARQMQLADSVKASRKTRPLEVLSHAYRSRTLIVWVLWATSYFVANGLNNWLPSLYRTFYHMPLQEALRTASITNMIQVVATLLCAVIVDKIGRRSWTIASFVVAGLALLVVWITGAEQAFVVVVFASLAYGVIGSTNTLLYLYTPEIYPTRMRAVATALATSWLRAASAAGPALVGVAVEMGGLNSVFLVFAVVCVFGAIAGIKMIETRGRRLEDLAA
jgi:putative MFS transporter